MLPTCQEPVDLTPLVLWCCPQIVMPPLLHSAQLKPDVHITDLEGESDGEEDDDEEVHPKALDHKP